MYAHKLNGAAIPDPISVIRSFDSETILTRPVRPSPLSASNIQGLPLDLIERLRSFPLFQSAPDSFLATIGSQLRPQLYSAHDYILTEGDEAKAMYWLVRGSLRVTSRDGESTYAELKPGAFFGEIGILMDIPRTATIIAKLKSLVVRLNKEDLQKVLPSYPDVERVIRDEAAERLTILERKKKESGQTNMARTTKSAKRPRSDGDVVMGEVGSILRDGQIISSKKRKSPSPSLADTVQASGLGSATFNVRHLLKELPLFASLPPEILHFIGMNAQPRTYPPFTDIIKQGSTGRDVFFVVRGEVEVINDMPIKLNGNLNPGDKSRIGSIVKARLKAGQYFGEVVSLSLAKRRTATVRSVSSAECLMISGSVLDELWDKCSPDLRRQVERTARDRLETARQSADGDTLMNDADNTPAISKLDLDDVSPASSTERVPKVTFAATDPTLGRIDEVPAVESVDPDPYLNVDLENVRSRSRRGSLAPPSPSIPSTPSDSSGSEATRSPHRSNSISRLSWPNSLTKTESMSPIRKLFTSKPRPTKSTKYRPQDTIGIFPDKVLINMFQHLDIYELMKLRLASHHWKNLITNNPNVLRTLDLTAYNRFVTDEVLTSIICPLVGNRPQHIDISNCFHVTDEGFTTLATTCAGNVKSWRMKSVWDITGQAVLDMVNKAKGLEDIDLSNCRKVGDNLLARVVGWVVPEILPSAVQHNQQLANRKMGQKAAPPPNQPAPGTVVGCPRLKRLTLSYCKHITDRSMAHIAVHASSRLEEMDLTRCTTITDGGFQHWSIYPFPRLQKLILADCTYLTDHAIVCLTNAAKALKELDLVSGLHSM